MDFDTFVERVDDFRNLSKSSGWKVLRTNRNGKFYIQIKWNFMTRPNSPRELNEIVRGIFPDARMTSCSMSSEATYRINL